MRYGSGSGIVKRTVAELNGTDRNRRKIMAINKEFHLKTDVDRLLVARH